MEEIIDFLTNNEKEVFTRVVSEIQEEKRSLESKQIKEIASIEEWVENYYYVGPDGMKLYDFWKEELIEIFSDNGRDYNEIIVTGGIGTGKSTFSLFAMIRKLYELSCYENICDLFDLMSSTLIVFIYFSVTKTQAELTGFGQFRDIIDSIPYFRNEFKRNDNLNSVLQLPENILFTHGSKAAHSIGMSMIGSILDEANFFDNASETSHVQVSNQDYRRVSNLYSSIVNRRKSRFMDSGYDHGLSILVSSSTHTSSFTEKRIQESLEDPHTRVIKSRLWDVKPQKYSDQKFWVFIGSESLDPFIVEDMNDLNQFLDSEDLGTYIEGECTINQAIYNLSARYKHLFTDVPVDFKESFKVNLVKSLQEIAGVSVAPMGRLFTSRPVYHSVCDSKLEHPFTKETLIISTGTRSTLDDFLKRGFRFKNPKKDRYIHIDQSETTDSTGISMVHVADMREINSIVKPIIQLDFMLRIDPPRPPKKISISKIRDFVFFLRDRMGLSIKKVTYDWFGSQESRQVLNERGIDAEHQSVDSSDDQYLTLVNLFFENRIILYDYKPFREELFDLIHDRKKRKVDHPRHSSDDVADSLAGAVDNALGDEVMDDYYNEELGSVFADVNADPMNEIFTMSDLLGDTL